MSRPVVLAVSAVLIALASVAAVPLALKAKAEQSPPALVPGQVVNGACDSAGGVKALQILVEKPGIVELSWDNKVVCGAPA